MKEAINQIFWGFFLVFLRIEIGIDWLADPLGYYLISLGCFKLQQQYQETASKARYVANAMIFISVPTVFVNPAEQIAMGWQLYAVFLIAMKLIVVYFLFVLLKEVVGGLGSDSLSARTERTSRFYIGFFLLLLAYLSFQMNVSGSGWDTIFIMLTIGAFFVDIVLLVLLRAIRRAVPDASLEPSASQDELSTLHD